MKSDIMLAMDAFLCQHVDRLDLIATLAPSGSATSCSSFPVPKSLLKRTPKKARQTNVARLFLFSVRGACFSGGRKGVRLTIV